MTNLLARGDSPRLSGDLEGEPVDLVGDRDGEERRGDLGSKVKSRVGDDGASLLSVGETGGECFDTDKRFGFGNG